MKITKCPYAGPDIMDKEKLTRVIGQKYICRMVECVGCGKKFSKKYKQQLYCDKCKKEYYKKKGKV